MLSWVEGVDIYMGGIVDGMLTCSGIRALEDLSVSHVSATCVF